MAFICKKCYYTIDRYCFCYVNKRGWLRGWQLMNYAEVIEFVKQKTTSGDRPNPYPFRSRFEHTMRVYRWAIRLQAKLGGNLDVIVLSALLHDVGWEEGRPHEEVSAEIAVEYLDSIEIDPETIKRVGEIILLHADIFYKLKYTPYS